ncbi:arsenate reductase (glutaredoxin) [Vibrio sp. 10N.286.49.B3]|uniref:arsenate reductase (glutaredoxin) n=1 Tax=Vibrio sp. 10N.286.49.B3 TaxID=1880855 RepID=UPI000C820FB2|nr:arsenate reductase (glutaredoxin) [Vibrio sp. 10N.286.49.B3]PMH41066.1 arsenate reductase (glutaredoxin) [Vibrio sp. 10N.286.49.B3]
MSVTIYHNPKCSKSRQTLALLEENGVKPEVHLYLKQPLSLLELKDLFSKLGFESVREMMRIKDTLYKELELDAATVTEAQLFTAIANNSALLERPIVVANNQAKVGRPPEQVLEII